MNPERSQRVRELFRAVQQRPPSERSLYLREACGEDQELIREVESLFTGETRADSGLGQPAWQDETSLLPSQDSRGNSELAVATRLGPYEVLGLLGAGGMGQVYLAKDTRLGREVALKLLSAYDLRDPERHRRFLQEARAVSALNHPHIITFHDLLEANGRTVLVMEYVRGKTLNEVITPKGLPLNLALKYAVQIADGLAAAHAAGIVHRDLKPANIMVTESGTVKLLDFGLAKLREWVDDPQAVSTRTGIVLGTFTYMSPEQAEAREVDARSDIFSFGCLLYEMLTGARPFRGDTPATIVSAILRDEPADASAVRRDLPSELNRIVRRCLRKDPARRFQDAADLKVALLEVQEEIERGPAPEVGVPLPRKRRWHPAAIAAALVALCAAGWFAFQYRNRADLPVALTPLTSYPGYEFAPALSPDGNQVAFEWEGQQRDNHDIYVKLVGTGDPLRLTTDPARDHTPAWSPDGRWIAFQRELPEHRSALLLIPALGGAERRVAETSSLASLEFTYFSSRTLTWTPDGKGIVVSDRSSPDEPAGLFVVLIDTGEKRRLTMPDRTATADRSPAFSPDGRFVAFSRFIAVQSSDLFLLPVTADVRPDGEPKPLTKDHSWNDSPVWFDSNEVLFSSDRNNTESLWRMAAKENAVPRRLPISGEALTLPALSRQTHRLVAVQRYQDANIWSLRLSELRRSPPSAPEIVAPSSRFDSNPDFSHDGRRIAFQSDRAGTLEIWVSDSDGLHPRQLTFFGRGHTGTPRWSPDGKSIAFDSNAEGQFEVYTVSADGGTPKRRTDLQTFHGIPAWSRDGQWIYCTSPQTGTREIWKVPATATGPPVQVTKAGGLVAAESLDGHTLYYTKGAVGDLAGSLWRAPVNGGPEQRVVDAVVLRNFAISAAGIYYARPEGSKPPSIHFLDFARRKDELVGSYRNAAALGLALSGDRLLFAQIDQEGSDLMVAENVR